MTFFNVDFLGGLLPTVHGGADGSGGLVAVLDKVLDGMNRALEPGSGGFELLPGALALGLNVHPAVVHYPIALLTLFWLLDVIGSLSRRERLRQAAAAMLYCGTVGALLAVAAGLYAEHVVTHGQVVHEIMEWHERLGLTVTVLALGLSLWRLLAKTAIVGMANVLHLSLASLMVLCLIFGADLGGQMVYRHGVAVQQLQDANAEHHHHDATLAHPHTDAQ